MTYIRKASGSHHPHLGLEATAEPGRSRLQDRCQRLHCDCEWMDSNKAPNGGEYIQQIARVAERD
jgi:hypothetical protein